MSDCLRRFGRLGSKLYRDVVQKEIRVPNANKTSELYILTNTHFVTANFVESHSQH